ncbi:MAG: hypothetical protein AAF570_18325, partial [Bacteroidota bacterium]
MIKSGFIRHIIGIFLAIFFMFAWPAAVSGQKTENTEKAESTEDTESEENLESDLERTFMPTVQMGYVWHGTEELSGGLMTQTSVEYRDISNFIFRLNYDAFNSNMSLAYPIDSTVTFTGRTTFSELIIGVGYRLTMKKHNITAYVQPGFRFYGYPILTADSSQVNLDYDSRNVGIIR